MTGFDKPDIWVNCGRCPECIKQKSDDWFVRGYYEMVSQPYDMFFVTLDFDDRHLPLYKLGKGPVRDYDVCPPLPVIYPEKEDGVVPCFDSEIFKHFLSRLRYYVPAFRYLAVPEFGGFLKRPHIHTLFLFPKYSLVTKPVFINAIMRSWQQGSHTDIELLDSVSSDRFKALEYIVHYTTKDFSFDLDKKEKKLPQRYRSRIMASGHFGDYALQMGIIDYKTIRDVGFVYINGFKYRIPRYYEQKICYDYEWDSENKKALRPLNEKGKELARIRHNGNYVHYIRSFFASRYQHIELDSQVLDLFNKLYPDSPYNGMMWRDIVFDAMSDFDIFVEYCRVKDFVIKNRSVIQSGYLKRYKNMQPLKKGSFDVTSCSVDTGEYKYPYEMMSQSDDRLTLRLSMDYDLPMQACFLFDLSHLKQSERKNFVEVYKSIENAKKRAWHKIRNNPQKARYLRIKGFDFMKLRHVRYADYVRDYFPNGDSFQDIVINPIINYN